MTEPNPTPPIDRRILEELAGYTRSLEEECDGPECGEGEPLIAANGRLADDRPVVFSESEEWGHCPDNTQEPGGPHRASPSLCVFCLEYDPE